MAREYDGMMLALRQETPQAFDVPSEEMVITAERPKKQDPVGVSDRRRDCPQGYVWDPEKQKCVKEEQESERKDFPLPGHRMSAPGGDGAGPGWEVATTPMLGGKSKA